MKILTFMARRFWWKSHSRTLEDVAEVDVEDEVHDAVVAFIHAEASDFESEERSTKVFRKSLKHLKWLANKRDLKVVVLHSFTHLGGETAASGEARDFLDRLEERLQDTGYRVERTPFGYFCEWGLDVFGESLAKVWKEF